MISVLHSIWYDSYWLSRRTKKHVWCLWVEVRFWVFLSLVSVSCVQSWSLARRKESPAQLDRLVD